MQEEEKYCKFPTVSVVSVESSSTPPLQARTWGNDCVQDERKRQEWTSTLRWKLRWSWKISDYWKAAYRSSKKAATFAWSKILAVFQNVLWPLLKRISITWKQTFALFLVLTCGFTPLIILGYLTAATNGTKLLPFYGVFMDKTLMCGQGFSDAPQNATISGIENLFVLDNTFGRFSFSQVKTIDVLWDLLVGRGLQIFAWWIAYIVFSDALLRVIERHPASFRVFQRIALEGPSLHSLWTLIKEIWTAKDRKTKALFAYMIVSITFVLCVPIFLGAMTGYDSTNIAWVDVDDSNNIVPASMVKEAWIILGTKNQTFEHPVCKDYNEQSVASSAAYDRLGRCE